MQILHLAALTLALQSEDFRRARASVAQLQVWVTEGDNSYFDPRDFAPC
jgi:hypothetical protein